MAYNTFTKKLQNLPLSCWQNSFSMLRIITATIRKRNIAVENSVSHGMSNVAHIAFYAIFKVGERYDEIAIDQAFEVVLQSKVTI